MPTSLPDLPGTGRSRITPGWGGKAGQTLTCLLNKRWSNPFLGCGEGCPFQSRSGGTVPSVLKTFSSLKHSVSIIWKREKRVAASATWSPSPRAQQSVRAAGTTQGHCPWNKDLPRSAKEWAHSPWQTSGKSHCLWAPAPLLSPWRTARCPEHPCSRWPGATQHKACSNARLHLDATTSNCCSWPSPGHLSLQPRARWTPALPGPGKGMGPISPCQGSLFP